MDTLLINREEILARAYEEALRSAFAHGSHLTDFHFPLPRPDDIVLLAHGAHGLRGDAPGLGYDAKERAMHPPFLATLSDLSTSFTNTVPALFLTDADTIAETHRADLAEIAHGIIRSARNGHTPPISPHVFHAFAQASFAFHAALLAAMATLFSLHTPATTQTLVHGASAPSGIRAPALFETLLRTEEELSFATRRLHHADLINALEVGSRAQRIAFLTFGKALGIERDFFTHHLARG